MTLFGRGGGPKNKDHMNLCTLIRLFRGMFLIQESLKILPHAAVVEQSAWEIVQAVIGRELSEDQRAQV